MEACTVQGTLTIWTQQAKSSFLEVGLCDVEESLISHIEVIRLKHDDYFIKYNKIRKYNIFSKYIAFKFTFPHMPSFKSLFLIAKHISEDMLFVPLPLTEQ